MITESQPITSTADSMSATSSESIATETSTESGKACAFSATATNIRQTKRYMETINFDKIIMSIGENFLANTDPSCDKKAHFIVRKSGLYMFHAKSVARGNWAAPLTLIHNDREILRTGRDDSVTVSPYPIGTGHALVALQEGDELDLNIEPYPDSLKGLILNKFTSPSDIKFSAFMVQPL